MDMSRIAFDAAFGTVCAPVWQTPRRTARQAIAQAARGAVSREASTKPERGRQERRRMRVIPNEERNRGSPERERRSFWEPQDDDVKACRHDYPSEFVGMTGERRPTGSVGKRKPETRSWNAGRADFVSFVFSWLDSPPRRRVFFRLCGELLPHRAAVMARGPSGSAHEGAIILTVASCALTIQACAEFSALRHGTRWRATSLKGCSRCSTVARTRPAF